MRVSTLPHRWLIGLGLCAMLLSACQPAPAANKFTFMVFGDPSELKAYQTLVEAFQTQHPNLAVDLLHIPGQADYRARLSADLAAGTPADVVLINYRRMAGLANKGALEPLGPRLEKSTLIQPADFFPVALEAFTWQGELMCIPQNISSLVVYYNKALFDVAGVAYPVTDWTWDDFLTTAQALTRDTDGDGQTDQYGLGVEPEFIRVAPFIWQNGGGLITEGSLALTLPEAQEAVRWFVEWQTIHHIVPTAEEELAESSESRFQNGRTAMYLNSRRIVPTLRDITALDWDVAPLPQNAVSATLLHSDAYCLPTASQHKDSAWTFIEFANSVEGQTIIAGTGRTVPSLKAVAESAAFLDPNAKPSRSQVFLDIIPDIYPMPLQPNWAEMEEIVDEELQRAFYGNATVSEALQSAVNRTTPLFTEND